MPRPAIIKGQIFASFDEFKEEILRLAVAGGWRTRTIRSDSRMVKIVCAEGYREAKRRNQNPDLEDGSPSCPFSAVAGRRQCGIRVTQFEQRHTCSQRKFEVCRSSFLQTEIPKLFVDFSNVTTAVVILEISQRFSIPTEQIPTRTVRRALQRLRSRSNTDVAAEALLLLEANDDVPGNGLNSQPSPEKGLLKASGEDQAPFPCPKCGAPVRGRHRRIPFSEIHDFCRRHRRREAKKEWPRRGYPHIDWDALPERLQRLPAILTDFLAGRQDSPYYERLKEDIGGQRTGTWIMNSGYDGNFVGYYGHRGQELM